MSINTEYKREVDSFCEKAYTISGEEVLAMAKRNEINSGEKIKVKGVRSMRTIGFVAAACVAFSSVTAFAAAGAAGYGPMAGLFRETLHDEVTASIVDEGHIYTPMMTASDGIFRADLIAVTGDGAAPKLLFDFYIDDPEVAAANDEVRLLVYTLGEEQYRNELDKYGPNEAYGKRDPEINNLYHVSVTGTPFWMTTGEPFIAAIRQVGLDIEGDYWTEHEVNMEYLVTAPETAFRETVTKYYGGEYLDNDGVRYNLTMADFGSYGTDLLFWFQYPGSGEPEVFENDIQEKCQETADRFVIVTDKGEYRIKEENGVGYYCDTEAETGFKDRCYMTACFDAVDLEGVQWAELRFGDTVIDLIGSGSDDQEEQAEQEDQQEQTEEDTQDVKSEQE